MAGCDSAQVEPLPDTIVVPVGMPVPATIWPIATVPDVTLFTVRVVPETDPLMTASTTLLAVTYCPAASVPLVRLFTVSVLPLIVPLNTAPPMFAPIYCTSPWP